MPYDPRIQNISGELLAQGMRERAQGVAGGLTNWLKGYEQNQNLKNQSLAAFSGLLGSDPDFQAYVNNVASGNVQVPAAVSKAIKNYQNGDIDVYDAAILGNTGQAFAKNKNDVMTRQHLAAQTAAANAQVSDIASQARLREAQAKQIEAKQSMIDRFLGQQTGTYETPSDKPTPRTAAPDLTQTEEPGLTMNDKISNMARQANKGLPNANISDRHPFYAPTSSPPTFDDALRTILRTPAGMAVFDHPDIVMQLHKDNYDRWFNTERPIGYVAGGQETDKDGNRVNLYYQVSSTNGGTIKQAKEPLKVYEGRPAPGIVLDGTTFMPNAASRLAFQTQQNEGNQIAQAFAPELTKKAKDDIIAASNNVARINVGLEQLQKLDDINQQMISKRWGRASGFTGTDFFNRMVEPLMGDETGVDFNSVASSFRADTMSNVRNIRNVYEFKAVTGNVPDASQPPGSRTRNIETLRDKLLDEKSRLTKAIQLMQTGVEPDSAFANANLKEMDKVPVANTPGIGESAARPIKQQKTTPEAQPSAPAKAKKSGQPPVITTQEQYDKLEEGDAYVTKDGKPHVKGGLK